MSALPSLFSLAIANGAGRLVRRERALLFDPVGSNVELQSQFRTAPSSGEAIASVKRALIAADFAVSPVVAVSWGDAEVDIVVFGDVEVSTSVSAAAMLTGAGSATWVERHLAALELSTGAEVVIWVGTNADEGTDLQLGTAAAAGFRLGLVLTGLSERIGPSAPRFDETSAVPPPLTADTPDYADMPSATRVLPPEAVPAANNVPEPAVAPDPVVAAEAAPTPEPASESVANVTPELSDSADVGDSTDTEDLVRPRQPELVSVPPASGDDDPFEDLGAESSPPDAGVGLVEAAVCGLGHPNPPRSVQCLSCQEALSPDSSWRLIEQPALGQFQFRDGQHVAATGRLLLGRKPRASDSALIVILEQAEVSRSHAELAVEGWTVLLTDLGSSNGTYVSTPTDPSPLRLEANVPHYLEAGTVVHLGGAEAAFTYVFAPVQGGA